MSLLLWSHLSRLVNVILPQLNVLHWHVVDSQSFPLQVPAFPELAEKGAYDSKSIYKVEDIKQIVEYAGSVRGFSNGLD